MDARRRGAVLAACFLISRDENFCDERFERGGRGVFGGARLKRIGRAARLELNALFAKRYHLTLWVKVRENWADDARALQQLEVE